MPLKLKLRKSRQYNVSTKSLYVLTVELLDSSTIDCTLTADSTGRDCLENICQRLGLQQPEFFGLRFEARRCLPRIRWVELDKPVKKQLEKYGDDHKLYLGVMFYITDVHLIHDEITRYQYFLQLKQDVLEGKLACNQDQAISLAAYSLQAEFGDHDPERHTLEYLKEFALLPKGETDSGLIELVMRHHVTLQSLSPTLAEVYYILEAQKLDGYGVDFFPAKTDSGGQDCFVGSSLLGIVIRYLNPPGVRYCRWSDITNLVNQKRVFTIECQRVEDSAHFVFSEQELAKYVWKTCVSQHSFFKGQTVALGLAERVLLVNNGSSDNSAAANGAGGGGNAHDGGGASSSMPNHSPVISNGSGGGSYGMNANSGTMSMGNGGTYDLDQGHKLKHQQPQQQFCEQYMQRMPMPASHDSHPGYNPGVSDSSASSSSSYPLALPGGPGMLPPSGSSTSLQSQLQQSSLHQHQHQAVHAPPLMSAAGGDNSLNLGHPGSSQAAVGHASSLPHLRRIDLLPSYRPAPDYETAMRQKYRERVYENAVFVSGQAQQQSQQHHPPPQFTHQQGHNSGYASQPQLQQQQQQRYYYQNQVPQVRTVMSAENFHQLQQQQAQQLLGGLGGALGPGYQRNSQPDFGHLTAQMAKMGVCERQ